ncbi:MAG: methylated-DNA--[protein]-cysteine S-methyltransferase [Acidimicrobiales bacterium]|nr:methylated-DNA--[protein]-cysteine S-methyltransferase [Acidimicrobiales bacterium]
MSYTHEEIEARLRAAAANLDSGFDRAGFVARAADEGLVDVAWCRVDSPVGPLVVAGTGAGLLAVSFDEADAALGPIAEHVSPRILEMPDRLDPVRRQLDEYFAGRRHRFALSLDRRLSRGFRATVLRALEAVDYGQTVSYAELAARAGNPQAFRAVGSAMATNPIPIVVPCHRVLRTGGGLGGYAGGLEVKRWLLDLEGVGTPPA